MKVTTAYRALALTLLCLGAAGRAEADSGCHRGAPFLLAINDGMVSLEAKNTCLGDILGELADRGYAKIHLPQSLADKRVSASFDGLPLQQAIKLILKDTSYALQTKSKHVSSADEQPSDPGRAEIWLAPAGSGSETVVSHRGSGPANGPERLIDLVALAEQSRFSPEPEVRAYAVQLIAQSDDRAKAAEFILAGLQDPAPQVRRVALMALAELDPAVMATATDLVTEIALHDESPELRKQALMKLVDQDFPRQATALVLRRAMDDENPEIKNLAKDLSKLIDK